jgi:hypothetical protein
MIGFLTSKTSKKLNKDAIADLKRVGWKVSIGDGKPADFRIDKGILKFCCECADRSIFDFRSSAQLLDIMESHARDMPKGISLFFVTNFELPHLPFDELVGRGFVAMTIDELHIVNELRGFLHSLPTMVGRRQAALLESNPWACINISKQYIELGDYASAVDWGKRAINENNPVSGAHHVVFNLLVETGDVDGARKLATEAVARKKDDLVLLRGLYKLSIQRGDTAEVEVWKARLTDVESDQPTNLNKILKKPTVLLAAAPAKVDPAVSKRQSGPLFRWITHFTKRVRPSRE